MTILILADHQNVLSQQTEKVVSAAQAIGGDIDILICGHDVKLVADEAAKIAGVRKILLAEADYLEHQLAEPVAATLVKAAKDYDIIMTAATTVGKNVMPRVAALLDVMQISDIIEVVSKDTFKRPIYAGNAIETVQSLDAKKVITVRTTAFKAVGQGGSAHVEAFTPATNPDLSNFVSQKLSKNERPDLSSAKVVVSGGRGLGSEESFQAILMPLADKLNAAIGASRAAVDAGFAPNDSQVGQTGKIVAPDLYFAIGLSGAIQHLAGMKDSRVIVAINKDDEAPIMQIADYALKGDLFEIVPDLIKAL